MWAAYITNVLASGQTFDTELNSRTTLLEQTTVTRDEFHIYDREVDTKFDNAINDIKDCLNKIQQDRLCD